MACATRSGVIGGQTSGIYLPESVEEHRVAGRTLNTDWGEQYTTKMSSSVNASAGWESTSASIDLEMTIRVGAPGVVASAGRATWNENGTGSSSFEPRLD